MGGIKLRIVGIVMATVIVVAVLAGAVAARSRSASRSAVVSGRIFLDGGPPGPLRNGLHRRSGTVIVRTDGGNFVARTHATAKHGFRLRLAPGSYELNAIVIVKTMGSPTQERDCPAETKVRFHAGANPQVQLFVGCETP
jgi:hypothetical protein